MFLGSIRQEYAQQQSLAEEASSREWNVNSVQCLMMAWWSRLGAFPKVSAVASAADNLISCDWKACLWAWEADNRGDLSSFFFHRHCNTSFILSTSCEFYLWQTKSYLCISVSIYLSVIMWLLSNFKGLWCNQPVRANAISQTLFQSPLSCSASFSKFSHMFVMQIISVFMSCILFIGDRG